MKKRNAFARIRGREKNPGLHGLVRFLQRPNGVLVIAEVFGLPQESACGIFAMHIHEGEECSGTIKDEFSNAKTHYNPNGAQHPCHAGDLPPLFSNNGYAYMQVFTNRFTTEEIVGRTLIIHDHPDDFMTQPSGNAGNKIACGVIM